MRAIAGALVVAAATLGACASPAPTPSGPIGQFGGEAALGIANGTTLTVTVWVNGNLVLTSVPGAPVGPIVFSRLPPFPWTVEARSPTGRVLTSMTVDAGSVSAKTDADGNLATSGTMGRVDLSCGRLTIFAGYNQPSGPQPPSPAGSPGDCAP